MLEPTGNVAVVDASAVDEPLAPGLHVLTDAEPLTRAKQLAADLQGDLCATCQEADDLLAELTAFPPLDADGILVVRRLSDRVAAAQRIAERTLERAAVDVGERLAAVGSGVAVHPATVRDRAAAVVSAREALEQAEVRLADARTEGELAATTALEPRPVVATAPVAEAPSDGKPPRRRRRLFGFGRRRDARDEEDTSESTSLLQQMAASTDEAFGARRAIQARSDLLVLLEAQRDRAQEVVRVAERSWAELAGDDQVEDVDVVVRRFDPQYEELREMARDAVGVRVAATLVRRAVEHWEEGWRTLQVPAPESIDHEWVVRLADRMARPVVLVDEAVGWAERIARRAPAAPVLAVEPAS